MARHTHWPYKSSDGRKKDSEVFLPAPIVEDGVWHLSSDDLQCLSIGCGILGSGGGGDPAEGKQLAIEGWLQGRQLKVYNPDRFDRGDKSKTMFCVMAFLGDPKAAKDIGLGVEATNQAFKLVQQALASKVCDPDNRSGTRGNDLVRVTKKRLPDGTVVYLGDIDDLKKIDVGPHASIPKDHKIVGFFTAETGGVNTMVPIRGAAEMVTDDKELYVIDVCAEGRSIPKLTMWLPFLNGIKPYPSTLSNIDGDKLVCCTHVDNAKGLEDFFRAKCEEMKDVVGVSFGVMSLENIINMCVPYGISHAWEIGRTVIRATRKNLDPVKAVLKEERGSLVIISGKIIEVVDPKNCKEKSGFNYIRITISGNDRFAGYMVTVRAQNEIYAALSKKGDKMYACTPDIISMVDPKTGLPMTCASSDNLKGQMVSLICLLCDGKLRDPKFIDVVGPKAYPDLVKDGFTSYVNPSSVLGSSQQVD